MASVDLCVYCFDVILAELQQASQPALQATVDVSKECAFRDRRFSPIDHSEVKYLRAAVSLLTDHEVCGHLKDWEIGIHGVTISFVDERKTEYSATFLPEVAHEQGWDHDETVQSLVRKAGYRGRITPSLLRSAVLTKYKSSKVKLPYHEYEKLRQDYASAARIQAEARVRALS